MEIVENGDGNCLINVNFDEGEVNLLLNFAVNEILRRQLDGKTKNEEWKQLYKTTKTEYYNERTRETKTIKIEG